MSAGFALGAMLLVVGCSGDPRPRTFIEYMEDSIAREATLARCNASREASKQDIECANARHAAIAIAAREEAIRREALERESERKRAALRARAAAELEAQRQAEAAAQAAAEAAYEARWESDTPSTPDSASSMPTDFVPQAHPTAANTAQSTSAPFAEHAAAQPPSPLSFVTLPTHVRRMEPMSPGPFAIPQSFPEDVTAAQLD